MLETHQTHHVKLFNPIIVIYESLAQVKEFKYLGVLFASEGTLEREIGLRIRAAGAVLRSLYRTVVTKRAEPQGKALDLPVDRRSYPHLWS